ncbi:Imm49 family immunity protein [Streptomyces rubiginosohelvolus]|uniref:Imm49 family immunity protein n=1 Tax=Streptomyces rubiginosohelvolus TaxID=67362 RepID=UPI003F4E0F80
MVHARTGRELLDHVAARTRQRDALDDVTRCARRRSAGPPRPHPESVGPAPAPRTLLPLDTLALAAFAVQVHGWELGVRSGYLPAELLGSPDTLRRAAESEPDNSGPWYAK